MLICLSRWGREAPSTVPWFHELFRPIIASYMQDVMSDMPGGMDGGR